MNHAAKNRTSLLENTPDLDQALRLLRRENRTYIVRAICCTGCWFLAIISLLRWIGASSLPRDADLFPLVLSLLCLVGGAILLPPPRSCALQHLTQLQNTRAVAPLLNSLEVSFGAKNQAIRSLLTQLLPRLTPAETGLLNRSHLAILWRAVEVDSPSDNLDYILAIVAALEHVGNRDIALRLRGLIALGAVTPEQQRIREAAEKCLIGLETRLAQEQVSGTLLRAASSSQTADELLRPLASHPDAQTDTLLKPTNRPTE